MEAEHPRVKSGDLFVPQTTAEGVPRDDVPPTVTTPKGLWEQRVLAVLETYLSQANLAATQVVLLPSPLDAALSQPVFPQWSLSAADLSYLEGAPDILRVRRSRRADLTLHLTALRLSRSAWWWRPIQAAFS